MDVNHLTPEEKTNITAIVKAAKEKGITNPFSLAALLSVIGKESGFHLKAEGSYRSTDNARLRKIFGERLADFDEAGLTKLKGNDIAFFDEIYGYKSEVGRSNGNTQPGDGWKYRGHGYNQTTFKNSLNKIGRQINVDLLTHPELVETPEVGAKVAVQYFINSFDSGRKLGKLAAYNSTGINDFKNSTDSLNAFYHANAGWGKTKAAIELDPTGGLAKARSYVDTIYKVVSDHKAATGAGLFFLILMIAAVAKRKEIGAALNNILGKKAA